MSKVSRKPISVGISLSTSAENRVNSQYLNSAGAGQGRELNLNETGSCK
jgi:hypothetical protein